MTTYIALLRGINVVGRNPLAMRDLVRVLQDCGLQGVQTYIQSGNAVFRCARQAPRTLANRIRAGIQQAHGFAPAVLLLDRPALRAAIARNPFAANNGKALHFYFLMAPARRPDLERLESCRAATEKFRLIRNVFYLYAPDGIGRSKLAAQVENCLGVAATARNENTVNRLWTMATE